MGYSVDGDQAPDLMPTPMAKITTTNDESSCLDYVWGLTAASAFLLWKCAFLMKAFAMEVGMRCAFARRSNLNGLATEDAFVNSS